MVGYMEETSGTIDDQGSRVLKKLLSSLKSNSHRKETYLFFSPLLEFYFTGDDMKSNL